MLAHWIRRLALGAVLLILSCATVKPVPIARGDICFNCRREITNTKLAAEIIDAQGRAFKFRSVWCLAGYLKRDTVPGHIFVTDYTSERLISAERASFVRAVVDPTTGERDYVAFRAVQDAVKFAQENKSSAVDWPSVLQLASAETTH